jgi:hypothetical protein
MVVFGRYTKQGIGMGARSEAPLTISLGEIVITGMYVSTTKAKKSKEYARPSPTVTAVASCSQLC